MATLTTAATTTQVRPWPAGGAWNNVALYTGLKWADKTTVYGVTLRDGLQGSALQAINEWMDCGPGAHTTQGQATAHAVGLELQESGGLATAQAGNGQTTNIIDRGISSGGGPVRVDIVSAIGATPTCTYQLEGSLDGATWNPLSSADSGTPTVFSTATFVVTTATTTTRFVDPSVSWRFLRLTMSANTNVTNTITVSLG